MNRRQALQRTAFSLAALTTIAVKAKTPAQVEGPFHPLNIDNDLRRLGKNGPFATGQQIRISGIVRDDRSGKGIANAIIEVWQADHNGKYNHPNDPLDYAPDPYFQFWGRAITDVNGFYEFFSIKPGSYPADEGWSRPPHIHFRVLKLGYNDLTTQMYFAGESLNDSDRILQKLSKEDQKKLIISLRGQSDSNIAQGQFNIELDPV